MVLPGDVGNQPLFLHLLGGPVLYVSQSDPTREKKNLWQKLLFTTLLKSLDSSTQRTHHMQKAIMDDTKCCNWAARTSPARTTLLHLGEWMEEECHSSTERAVRELRNAMGALAQIMHSAGMGLDPVLWEQAVSVMARRAKLQRMAFTDNSRG